MTESKSKKLAVIRVRGKINLNESVKNTFKLLNLNNKNWCVVIDDNPSNRGMIIKVKDYVTWGEIDPEIHKELFNKKGELYLGNIEDSKGKIKYSKYITFNSKNYKKYFRLSPPVGGFGKNGIKTTFNKSGALGNRKEKINDLIKKMM